MAIRQTIVAPLGNFLSRTMGGLFGGATASVLHTGGMAGAGGASRSVDPAMFAAAPRYHTGGIAGLAPDEVPAILQRGERVIPRGQSAGGAQSLAITVNVQGANGDQHVIDLVQQGVSAGVSALNNALPQRVQQILQSPRKQGWA
jgi:hypothetical protein